MGNGYVKTKCPTYNQGREGSPRSPDKEVSNKGGGSSSKQGDLQVVVEKSPELDKNTDMYRVSKGVEEMAKTIHSLQRENTAKDEQIKQKEEEIDRLKAQIHQLNSVLDSISTNSPNILVPVSEARTLLEVNAPLKSKKQGLCGETTENYTAEAPLTKHHKDSR